jgi:uncharacterized coiled-coil protein SlyX
MEQSPFATMANTLIHEFGHVMQRINDLEKQVAGLWTEIKQMWETLEEEVSATDELLEVLAESSDNGDPPHHIAYE